MFVTNWISTTKIQKISEITNFFWHYFLSRTEVNFLLFNILSWVDGCLDDTIFLILEHIIRLLYHRKRKTMCNERSGIYLALLYQLQDFLTVATIYSASLEGKVLAIHIRKRKHLRLVIHGHDGNYGVWTCAFPSQLEGVLASCHFHYHICSTMGTQLFAIDSQSSGSTTCTSG